LLYPAWQPLFPNFRNNSNSDYQKSSLTYISEYRNKSYRLSKIHDRRSRDLPRNAQVAEVEVDDPMALEQGEKIVACARSATIP
jgi:hypothetical protein